MKCLLTTENKRDPLQHFKNGQFETVSMASKLQHRLTLLKEAGAFIDALKGVTERVITP